MFNSLFCMVAGHSIKRHRVWSDGLAFRTKCRRCRKELIRTDSGWRPYDFRRDDDNRRLPHPDTN